MQIFAYHRNGMLAWSRYQFFFLIVMDMLRYGLWLNSFHIGSKITGSAVYNVGFTGICDNFKFVRTAAANGSCVCDYRAEMQSAAGKYTGIGIIHELILLIQTFFICVKGIGILHDEFTASHQTKTRSLFIAVLVLNLEQRYRQLLIGRGVHTGQRRNQFFMGRSQAVFMVMAILKLEHFRTKYSPASGFLPEFSRLNNRHHNLLASYLCHFFADDIFNLTDRSPCQR